MPKIFISYRRNDLPLLAKQIYTGLIQHFPKDDVFMDVDSITYGTNFLASIERHVILADIVLVLIGPYWNGQLGERRLMDQNDFVRLELELALRHQKRILPILIGPEVQFPHQDELPPSLATFHLLHAFHFSTRLSQQEQHQLLSFILAPSQPQRTQPQTPLSKPLLSSQKVTPIVPTPPSEFIFIYDQYRLVIPTSIYNLYEGGTIYVLSRFIPFLSFLVFFILGASFIITLSSAVFAGICIIVFGLIVSLILFNMRNKTLPALGLVKFRRQLLKIAQMSSRGDERNLIKYKMETDTSDPHKIFSWYQEYCRNPLDSEYAFIRGMAQWREVR